MSRPKNSFDYDENDILKYITSEPKNTIEIKREAMVVSEKISWITVQNMLKRLKNNGKIKGRRIGKIYIWYR